MSIPNQERLASNNKYLKDKISCEKQCASKNYITRTTYASSNKLELLFLYGKPKADETLSPMCDILTY